MSFREVRVFEVRELLRWWVEGLSLRKTTERSAFDRKTVRRYVEAAQELGVVQGGDGDQLTDEVLAAVLERVRPQRRDGRGEGWVTCVAQHDALAGWLRPKPDGEGLTVRRAGELLARRVWSCPSGPCTATRSRCWASAARRVGQRCASPTASPAWRSRSTTATSAGSCSTAGAARSRRWSSRPSTAGTRSCTSAWSRLWIARSLGSRRRGGSSAASSRS